MIRTQSLTRRFGDRVAVDGLDLEVRRGEVFGFLGPNGAGKTTTVRMLSSLIAPSSGTAEVVGCTLGPDNPTIRRRVGILTESPGLYERLSGLHNLSLFAEFYDVPDVAGQVERYLRVVGMWDRRHDRVSTYSKGMKQKLAIARCLLHEPELLFLDEPTLGLDPEATQMVRDFVLDLKAQGRTIFLCTHLLPEAERLCDRVAFFERKVLAIGTTTELRERVFGREIQVRVASLQPSHAATVRSVGGVEGVREEDGALVLTVADIDEVTPAVVAALVGAGARIRQVGAMSRPLDAVYMALVGKAKE